MLNILFYIAGFINRERRWVVLKKNYLRSFFNGANKISVWIISEITDFCELPVITRENKKFNHCIFGQDSYQPFVDILSSSS